jgi:hypothetical protein
MSGDGDFLPVDNPTLVQSQVRDALRKHNDGTAAAVDVARTIYEFAMFAKNRKIVRESDGMGIVGELLRSRDDEVVDYGCRIAAFFALDGPEVVHEMREMGIHRRALELVTSANTIVQSEAVNLIYWLAQDPESKQFLIDCNVSTILADAQVTAKDLTVAKFLSHANNAVLPTAKSAGELANLVEQSSLTSSIRSARDTLLSGASAALSIPAPGPSPLRLPSTKDDPKATQPYYTPQTGQEEEEGRSVGSVSAPKAITPAVSEQHVEIDQVKLTFSLGINNRKRLKKVLLSGNIQELGMWAPKKAPAMFQTARGDYEFEITLPSWRREFEYKYAVLELTPDGTNEDFVWESGFIRKCKLDNSRLQKVEDVWEGTEGLEDFAPDKRGRAITEQLPAGKGPMMAIKAASFCKPSLH